MSPSLYRKVNSTLVIRTKLPLGQGQAGGLGFKPRTDPNQYSSRNSRPFSAFFFFHISDHGWAQAQFACFTLIDELLPAWIRQITSGTRFLLAAT